MRSPKTGDTTMSVSNLISIYEFKQKYLELINDKTTKPEILRLFCLGKELKDDLFLFSYEIADEMAIQVMFKPAS